MHNLEDLLAAEIERQGIRATPEAFRHLLIETIGRVNDQGLVELPYGKGVASLTLKDFVKSYLHSNPESFESTVASQDASKEPRKPTGNLTTDMKLEIADTRNRSLPSDWNTVRNRHTGLTAQMMDEIADERQN